MTVTETSHYDKEFNNLTGLLFLSISNVIMEISDKGGDIYFAGVIHANRWNSEGLHSGHISIQRGLYQCQAMVTSL